MMKKIMIENMMGYNADQSSPYILYKKKFKNKIDREILNEYKSIILKYYPNYTDDEIIEHLLQLKRQGCTYAALANVIADYLNYDDAFVAKNFGFHLYEKNGEINCNKLMLDLFTCLSKMVRVRTHTYQWIEAKSEKEAAEQVLHRKLDNGSDAYFVLKDAGWMPYGKDSENNLIFRTEKCVNQSFCGDYTDIAKEIFGIEYPNLDKKDFMSLLNQNRISFDIDFEDIPSKLSGLFADKNHNLWVNAYFKRKNIDIQMETKIINRDWQSYEQFMVDMINRRENGSSIEIASRPFSEVWMTDGKLFGYTQLSSDGVGHQMTFCNFDQNGDIIVASWGTFFRISKEYYKSLEYLDIKMYGYSKALENEMDKSL